MDIFTKNRFTVITILLLILINIFTLLIIWFGRRDMHGPPMMPRPPENKDRPVYFLKNELGLTEEQVRNYQSLRLKHRKQMDEINRDIRRLKKELLDQLFNDQVDSQKVNQIIHMIGEKQQEAERVTFNHFSEMKKLCAGGQQEKLHKLFDEIFRPRPPGLTGGPPQSPGMDQAPQRPPEMDKGLP